MCAKQWLTRLFDVDGDVDVDVEGVELKMISALYLKKVNDDMKAN
jgi:hypothetical protein